MINIIWISFIFIALSSTIFIVNFLNPIYRLCMLIIIYLIGSFMYTIMDFYFLGLTYIIVYVGAIAILFLFVIMMIPVGLIKQNHIFIILGILGLLLGFMILLINSTNNLVTYFYPYWSTAFITLNDIYILGYSIYLIYPQALILIGLSLFVTMIGIIAVTSKLNKIEGK